MAKKGTDQTKALRDQLIKLLEWGDARATFDSAVEGLSVKLRGVRPEGLPYSPWQLLEHIRIAQRDILDFCIDPNYQQPAWPEGYWPKSEAPPSPEAWDQSVAAYRADRKAFKELVADPEINLFDKVPQGEGQTYLREVLLAADHGAYHVGELVAVRRLLGAWK